MTKFEFFKELEALLLEKEIDDAYLILEFYRNKVDEEIELGYTFDSIYSRTGSPAKCVEQVISDYNLSLEETLIIDDSKEKKEEKNRKLNIEIPEFGLPTKREVKVKKIKKFFINIASCILIALSVMFYLIGSISIVGLLGLAIFLKLDDSLIYFAIYLSILSFITFSILGTFFNGINYNFRTFFLKIDRKMKKLYYVLIVFITIFAMGYGTKLYLPYLAVQVVENNEIQIENNLQKNNPKLAKELENFDFSKITPEQRKQIYNLIIEAKDYIIENIDIHKLRL